MYSSVLKRLDKNIDSQYKDLKKDDIEVKAYNKSEQGIECKID